MAPKRHRGEEGSSSTSTRVFDKKKFVSAEAADKFDNVLADRPLVPERGLAPDYRDGAMQTQIIERRWGVFTNHPDPACTAIVKEFYANAVDTPACEVRVRGQLVSFSRATINAYYNLQAPENCQYSAMEANYDVIIQSLTQPGTVWKRNMRTGFLKSFPGRSLSRYGKIWYAFLCAKLMPCTHFSDVTVDRSKLLYAIVTDMTIDVGAVIEASIRRSLRGASSSGLPHPSLITELCRQAGVKWGSAEPLFPPTTLLDHQLIERYQVWPGGISHPRGLGFLIAPPPEAPPEMPIPPADPQPPVGALSLHDISAQLDRLQRRQAREHRRTSMRQTRIDRHHHRLAQRQHVQYQYLHDVNAAWVTTFSSLHPTADVSHFPVPPALPQYPPVEDFDDQESVDSVDTDDDDEDASDASDG